MFQDHPLRWGFIGCGKICYDFALAHSTLSKDRHVIHRVAARNVDRAKDFAEKFNIDNFSGCYEDVVKDPKVDVVYIGTVNSTHKELSILAMNHGKAVLCETPVTMNSKKLNEVLAVAKQNKVFFMEALWTKCNPLYREVLSNFENRKFGAPQVARITFGFPNMFHVEHMSNPKIGGSILLYIGIYTLSIADMIFAGEEPKEIVACGHVDSSCGIDRSESVTLLYEGNRTAQLLSDGDHKLENKCIVSCANGTLLIDEPFWSATKYSFKSASGVEEREFPLLDSAETTFMNSVLLRYEADHVHNCLSRGLLESDFVPHGDTQRVMKYMDEIRKQLNVKFAQD